MSDRSLRADARAAERRATGQPEPGLRDQIRRAVAEGGGWNFDDLEPHDFQGETTAVLAVVQPLQDQLGFIHAVLDLALRADFRSELLWHSDGTSITVAVDVSDVFAWGGSDAEDLTPDRLPLLAQAVDDLRAIHPSDDMYAVDLYAARLRGLRPQGAAYPKERAATQALFDACGPECPTGLGNPRKPPTPKESR